MAISQRQFGQLRDIARRLQRVSSVMDTIGGYTLTVEDEQGRRDVVKLPGLTEDLRAEYYSHYHRPSPLQRQTVSGSGVVSSRSNMMTHETAFRPGGVGGIGIQGSRQSAVVRQQKYVSGRAAMRAGLQRGKKVHNTMEDYVRILSIPKFIIDNVGRLPTPTDIEHLEDAFYRMHPQPHPIAERLIKIFKKWKWLPLYSELPVFDLRNLRRATEIDMFVYDMKKSAFAHVELKTGYDGVFKMPGSKSTATTVQKPKSVLKGKKPKRQRLQRSAIMEGNLQDIGIDNSPLSQATLQLVASCHMFSTVFGDIVSPRNMWIVHVPVQTDAVYRYAVEDDVFQKMHRALLSGPIFSQK